MRSGTDVGPGTPDLTVIAVIHPSMFCLVKIRSLCRPVKLPYTRDAHPHLYEFCIVDSTFIQEQEDHLFPQRWEHEISHSLQVCWSIALLSRWKPILCSSWANLKDSVSLKVCSNWVCKKFPISAIYVPQHPLTVWYRVCMFARFFFLNVENHINMCGPLLLDGKMLFDYILFTDKP